MPANLAALNRVNATTIDEVMAQVGRSEQILTLFYVFLSLFLILSLAAFLPTPGRPTSGRWGTASVGAGRGGFHRRLWRSGLYKPAGDPGRYRLQDRRPVRPAGHLACLDPDLRPGPDLAPNEDYYYLFLGRSYLEYAKTLDNADEREQLIQQAAADLKIAQQINPLNTDHTANLARLHSLWAAVTADQALHDQRAQLADQYFSRAVVLSPQNARLWDEWAVQGLNVMNQPEQAKERLETSLEDRPLLRLDLWPVGRLLCPLCLQSRRPQPGTAAGRPWCRPASIIRKRSAWPIQPIHRCCMAIPGGLWRAAEPDGQQSQSGAGLRTGPAKLAG